MRKLGCTYIFLLKKMDAATRALQIIEMVAAVNMHSLSWESERISLRFVVSFGGVAKNGFMLQYLE